MRWRSAALLRGCASSRWYPSFLLWPLSRTLSRTLLYQSSYIHSLGYRDRALACGGGRSGLRTVGAGCVGGGDALGGLCSVTFASTRFISSWLALSSSMA